MFFQTEGRMVNERSMFFVAACGGGLQAEKQLPAQVPPALLSFDCLGYIFAVGRERLENPTYCFQAGG